MSAQSLRTVSYTHLLINDGATKEDLAVSIFQAVVNQTISGLACGKPIRGHVAFLGGPLHFLSELKQCFIRTLKLDEEHTIAPEHSHLFAAIGSALNADEKVQLSLERLIEQLHNKVKPVSYTHLPPYSVPAFLIPHFPNRIPPPDSGHPGQLL